MVLLWEFMTFSLKLKLLLFLFFKNLMWGKDRARQRGRKPYVKHGRCTKFGARLTIFSLRLWASTTDYFQPQVRAGTARSWLSGRVRTEAGLGPLLRLILAVQWLTSQVHSRGEDGWLLGTELGASHMLSKNCITKFYSQTYFDFFFLEVRYWVYSPG